MIACFLARILGALAAVEWFFPLRGRWLRYALAGFGLSLFLACGHAAWWAFTSQARFVVTAEPGWEFGIRDLAWDDPGCPRPDNICDATLHKRQISAGPLRLRIGYVD